MSASILLGILIIAIGAFSSGSFSIPFDKVTKWKWENSWLTFSVFACLFVPLIICLIWLGLAVLITASFLIGISG